MSDDLMPQEAAVRGSRLSVTRQLPPGLREQFARFASDPSREGLRDLIRENVGESRHVEFKAEWPKRGALAKHILAFGNTEGGCLIVGVKEIDGGGLEAVGLEAIKDKAEVRRDFAKHVPDELAKNVTVWDFAYEDSDYGAIKGKRFQVLVVEPAPEKMPFLCTREGEGLREGATYIRHEGESREVTHDQMQRVINARIAAASPTAAEVDMLQHLEQLKALYEQFPKYIGGMDLVFGQSILGLSARKHPRAPKESFHEFVARMIELKKRRIALDLGVDA